MQTQIRAENSAQTTHRCFVSSKQKQNIYRKRKLIRFSFASTSKCKLGFKGVFKTGNAIAACAEQFPSHQHKPELTLPWRSSWLGFSGHTKELRKELDPLGKCFFLSSRCCSPHGREEGSWLSPHSWEWVSPVLPQTWNSEILAWPEHSSQNMQRPKHLQQHHQANG